MIRRETPIQHGCDEANLSDLLHGGEHAANHEMILGHLEHCSRCQQRFDALAATSQDWTKAREALVGNQTIPEGELDSDRWQFPLDIERSPVDWTESMAKSLLLPPSHPEMLGRIGRYEVERLIGSGGMGVVFKAYDTELNRPVAVKLLAPFLAENGSARQRFAREARAAAAVVDDHVVPIHNVETGEEPGSQPPFLVMKYIAGGSLQQRLDRDGPLDVCEILRIGMQTANGLAAAHAQGLIHRDVKPSNILLDEGVERALLTDFGLARAEDDACLTRSGFHPGTPHYMSPEQVRGEAIDGRSDLFGLGCVLYALCTGHPPFRAQTSYAVLRRITDDTSRPIRELNPDIPEWLEQIVMKLLSKSREDRFDSAEQVAELLEDCLAHVQHPVTAPLPESVAVLAPGRNRIRPWTKLVAAAAFAFSLLFAGVLVVVELNKGTLTIESEAENVPIRIMQGETVVKELTVSRNGKAVRIAAGKYIVEIDGETDDIEIKGSSVRLTRGGNEIASIVRSPQRGELSPKEQTIDRSVYFKPTMHARLLAVVENARQAPSPSDATTQATKTPRMHLRVFVKKSMLPFVRVGHQARIKIDALPTEILSGKVVAVMNADDPPVRSGAPGSAFEAIVSFDENSKRLKAGMTAEVDIEAPVVDIAAKPTATASKRADVSIEVVPETGVIALRGQHANVQAVKKLLTKIREENGKDLHESKSSDPPSPVKGSASEAISFDENSKRLKAEMTVEADIETQAADNAAKPKTTASKRADVSIEVVPETGVIVLRGKRDDVQAVKKTLSKIREKNSTDLDESKNSDPPAPVKAPRLPEHLDVIWEYTADDAIETTPTVVDDKVFVSDTQGTIHALKRSDGTEIWKKKYDTGFSAPPVIRGEAMVIGDVEGNLYAIDAETGAELWKQATGGEIHGAVAFFKDTVVAASQDGKLYCFDIDTGKARWTYETKDQIHSSPAIVGDRTFLGGCDGQLHVVDLNTGKAVGQPIPLGGPTGGTPVIEGDDLFLTVFDGSVVGINWKQQQEIWRYQDAEFGREYRNSTAVKGNYVIASSHNKQVDALHAASGKRIWRHTLKHRADASPVIAGDDVWIATTDGRLIRLALKDATQKWEYEIRGSFIAPPAIAGDQLFIADDEGVVRCLAKSKSQD